MTEQLLEMILKDYPDSSIVKKTQDGILVQTDKNKESYLVVPTYHSQGYHSFKMENPFQFRAFMYCLGSLCRELNAGVKEGVYDTDLRQHANGGLYYAMIHLKINKPTPVQIAPKSSNSSESITAPSYYLMCRGGIVNQYV